MNSLLLKIGKRIGLNLPYFVKNGSWVTLRFFVMALGGWLVALFFARLGSKETLGQYQLILSFISMVAIFSLPGLNSAALEAVVKGREAGVIKAVKLSFLCSLLGGLFFIGWGYFDIFFKHEFLLGRTLILSGIISPLYYAFNTWTAYYDGKSLFKENAVRMVILNICLSIFLILGLILKLNVFGLIAIYLLVNAFFFGYYFIEIVKKIKNPANDQIDVKFGINASIQKLILGLSGNVPPIMISFIFGVEMVAIYYIAYYIISASSAFFGTLSSLYIPILFKGRKLNHKNIIFQNIIIGAGFWIAFIVFLKFFFIFIYGAEYQKSLELAYKISFVVLLVPLKNYLIIFFMTQKRNWLLISTVGIANLAASLFLYFFKGQEFLLSVATYIYIIELITSLPLITGYILLALKEKEKVPALA